MAISPDILQYRPSPGMLPNGNIPNAFPVINERITGLSRVDMAHQMLKVKHDPDLREKLLKRRKSEAESVAEQLGVAIPVSLIFEAEPAGVDERLANFADELAPSIPVIPKDTEVFVAHPKNPRQAPIVIYPVYNETTLKGGIDTNDPRKREQRQIQKKLSQATKSDEQKLLHKFTGWYKGFYYKNGVPYGNPEGKMKRGKKRSKS